MKGFDSVNYLRMLLKMDEIDGIFTYRKRVESPIGEGDALHEEEE